MVGRGRLVELDRLQLDNGRPVGEIRRRSIQQTDVALCPMQEKQPVAGPQHECRYSQTCIQVATTDAGARVRSSMPPHRQDGIS